MLLSKVLCLSTIIIINSALINRNLLSSCSESSDGSPLQKDQVNNTTKGSDGPPIVLIYESHNWQQINHTNLSLLTPLSQLIAQHHCQHHWQHRSDPVTLIYESQNWKQIHDVLDYAKHYKTRPFNFNIYVQAALRCKQINDHHGYRIMDHLLNNDKATVWKVTFDQHYQFMSIIYDITLHKDLMYVNSKAVEIENKLNQHQSFHYANWWILNARQWFLHSQSEHAIISQLSQIHQQKPREFAYYVAAAVKCVSLGPERCTGLSILSHMANNRYLIWGATDPRNKDINNIIMLTFSAVFDQIILVTKQPVYLMHQLANIMLKCKRFGNYQLFDVADEFSDRCFQKAVKMDMRGNALQMIVSEMKRLGIDTTDYNDRYEKDI